jgi:hypothetical protein
MADEIAHKNLSDHVAKEGVSEPLKSWKDRFAGMKIPKCIAQCIVDNAYRGI